MSQPFLSVVLPAYNEAERLKRHIPHIREHLQGKTYEIIVANDGSKDETSTVARSFEGVRVIDLHPNRGKGGAVKAGMLAAAGRYVLFTDSDESTPIAEVDKLLEALEADRCDMAIGSRGVPGAKVQEPQAWYRALASKLFGLAAKILCVHGVYDTQCGFKCMKREVAQRVFPQVTSASAIFDIEMLVVATREGFRVAELPVKWTHDPDTRIPYNLRRAIKIWAELFRIRRAQRVGWPLTVKK